MKKVYFKPTKSQVSFEMLDLPINEYSQNFQHCSVAANWKNGSYLI